MPSSTAPAAHVHDWRPVQGRRARYSCATCPAFGYRPVYGGAIRETVVEYRPGHSEARPSHPSRKPGLDEIERRRPR